MMESKACGHGELCLGGMLAVEMMSLFDRVRGVLQGFFRTHEAWLTRVLAQGAEEGTLKFSGTAEAAGRAVFATVQDCMLVCVCSWRCRPSVRGDQRPVCRVPG